MKRVLVLGSRGFIGRNLVNVLTNDPTVNVTGFGRKHPEGLNGHFRFIEGSFEDPNSLKAALLNQDIVYHLISQTIPSSSWDSPEIEIQNNLRPAIDMIRIAADAGVKKICFASSGGTVYGLNSSVLNENDLTAPFAPYGIIKRTIESFLEYARHRYEINYDIYRISNAYGEGQDVARGLGFINTTLESILHGRPVVVYGDGEAVRDFIHVKDVAALLALSLKKTTDTSDIFNLSSNRPISLNDLLVIIRDVTKVDFAVEYRDGRLNDNKKVMLDNAKIMNVNPGHSLISLEDGVRETYNYLKKLRFYVEKSV